MINERRVWTEYSRKGRPGFDDPRSFDWEAGGIDDDPETDPIGYGATEEEAIQDYLSMITENKTMTVLPHLEAIGHRLLAADNEVTRLRTSPLFAKEREQDRARKIDAVRSQALSKADRDLEGSYSLSDATAALLRALEAACEVEVDLPADLLRSAACHLREARRDLQLALFMRIQRRARA